jgi:hypothetical protein
MEPPYISKDIDRIAITTASITTFFFIASWIFYGAMLVTGETTHNWRPMAHGPIKKSINVCLCRRNAGDEPGSENEECSGEIKSN